MVVTLRHHDVQNPDDVFVLHGRSPRFSERPRSFTASELTTTTRGLGMSPDHHTDAVSDMSGDAALRAKFLCENKLNLRNPYRKDSMTNLIYSDEFSDMESGIDTFGGEAKSIEQSGWYNYPIHLSRSGTDFPLFQSLGVSTNSVSSIQRKAGKLGAKIDAENKCRYVTLDKSNHCLNSQEYPSATRGKHDQRRMNMNSEREFPKPVSKRSQSPTFITVSNRSTSPSFRHVPKRSASPSFSPLSNHVRHQSFRSIRNRPASATISGAGVRTWLGELPGNTSVHAQRERPFTTEEHFELGWPLVSFCSPYASELSRLRIERLRLEEDTLLQMKREQELERIRAPKGKWYALKSPEFHYEAHKNNELLRLSSPLSTTNLRRYRNELTNASSDFQKSLGKVL